MKIYDGDIYPEAALQAALANKEHVIPFATLPSDIRGAYLACQHELDDLVETARATAVRANTDGWWCVSVKGNPVLLESQLSPSFPDADAINPNTLQLRRITLEEVPLFDAADQNALLKALLT
jgi:hypothetical protein